MEIFSLVSAATDATGAVVDSGGLSLDKVLNVLVPIAVFLMFGFMIYKNFGTEIDALIRWIKKQMAEPEQSQQVPINNPYMADGVIVYR